jgi:hypothetical protein
MLTRRILTALAAGLATVALSIVVVASPASADPPVGDCSGPDCEVIGGVPGDPGSGGGDGGSGGSSGCHFQGQTVPCTIDGLGWFNASNGCYYTLTPIPPFGDPHAGEEGNWYTVTCGMYNGGPVTTADVWVPGAPLQPPPDPAELARQALAKITLKGATIGMAPRPGTAGLVNLPVWMWTAVTPNTWGPISASASAGGLTVTITAKAEDIVWDMGDGTAVTCTSPGTPFTTGDGGRQSPTCGHTYLKPSRDRTGGAYTVTATTDWRVDWAGGGVTGVIDQTRTSQTTVEIDELQVVNR